MEACSNINRFTTRFFAPVLVDKKLSIEARVVSVDSSARRAVIRLTAAHDGKPAVMGEAEVVITDSFSQLWIGCV